MVHSKQYLARNGLVSFVVFEYIIAGPKNMHCLFFQSALNVTEWFTEVDKNVL